MRNNLILADHADLHFKPEGRANPQNTLYADLSTMGDHKLTRNCKAKACAAKTINNGLIGLCERVKNARLCFWGNANARIPHFEAQTHAPLCFLHHARMNLHRAMAGKFDRIADKIDQHFFKVLHRALHIFGKMRIKIQRQLDRLGASLHIEHVTNVLQHVLQREDTHLRFLADFHA